MKRIVLGLALFLAMPLPAAGQTGGPNTISYQGTLADASGNPYPDGGYTFVFRIYDTASGGTALWTQSHLAVAVSGGGFSVLLGAGTGIPLAFDKPYWISVALGANSPELPRTPLAASPYAMSLRLPYTATASVVNAPLITLRNTVSDKTLSADGTVSLGGTRHGRLDVGGPDSIVAILGSIGWGGGLTLKDEDGTVALTAYTTTAGEGCLDLHTSNGARRVSLTASSSEWVGSEGTVKFDLDQDGNAGVGLPGSSIADHEILDEPGLNSNTSQTSVSMDGTPAQSFNQRVGTMPDSGYVVVLSTFRVNIGHTTGTTSNANFTHRVVQNGVEHVGNTGIVVIPASAPTGTYSQTITLHDVFAALPGTMTTSLTGQEVTGGFVVYHRRTTTMFFPSDYGIVEESIPQALTPGGGNEPTASREEDDR